MEAWNEAKDYLGKTVDRLIETGRRAKKVREEVEPGKWIDFVQTQLPIDLDLRSLQRVIAISEHPVLSDAGNCPHLPASLRTLDELRMLPISILQKFIDDGTINQKTSRKKVKALIADIADCGKSFVEWAGEEVGKAFHWFETLDLRTIIEAMQKAMASSESTEGEELTSEEKKIAELIQELKR